MNKQHSSNNKPSGTPFWRTCSGYLFLGVGPLMILCALLYWTDVFFLPQIVQLGIIGIWTGVLLLQTGKTYFSVVSSLILTLSVAGFADNLIFDVGQPSNRDPKFVIHGLFCFAWMIAFSAQADLVRRGRLELHKRIGIAGFLAAIGFTISTLYVFYVLWKPWSEMLDRAQINRILVPSFAVLVVLAWIFRNRPEHHKRMILLGTLYLLLPIINRVVGGLPFVTIGLWVGFFVSMFLYDWFTAKRIHLVTYLGFTWFCLALGVAILT